MEPVDFKDKLSKNKNMIKPSDFVFLYHDERTSYLISLPQKGVFSTHKGNIDLSEIKGKEYGESVKTHLGKVFYLLKPAWADIEKKVRRTTTIIYPKDAGWMLLKTRISPGSRVIEAGTGSGAFTIILANLVRPKGRVYTYEKRQEFLNNAKRNIEKIGLSKYVEFFCRDVEKEGFSQEDVDALFIDLPEPWGVIAHSHKALKGGHFLISISPTIEQVQKTVSTLELTGFTRIRVVELLERELLVRVGRTRPKERMVSHTAYLLSAQKIVK